MVRISTFDVVDSIQQLAVLIYISLRVYTKPYNSSCIDLLCEKLFNLPPFLRILDLHNLPSRQRPPTTHLVAHQ